MPKRPYHHIPIQECNEALIPIPGELFAVETPHPYEKLGAPYGGYSPYFLRETVVEKLLIAQNNLQQQHPNWQIQIFDAYRPVSVQQFMVDYAFAEALQMKGFSSQDISQIPPSQLEQIWEQVYQIWAPPSLDLATPPPHSTGSAVDITLMDDKGKVINMGSPIDEMSERSLPDYYREHTSHPQAKEFSHHRQLLCDVMVAAGFVRNPREWWHFSYGDQMWAWLSGETTAKYGRI